jgi:hypothetical protein
MMMMMMMVWMVGGARKSVGALRRRWAGVARCTTAAFFTSQNSGQTEHARVYRFQKLMVIVRWVKSGAQRVFACAVAVFLRDGGLLLLLLLLLWRLLFLWEGGGCPSVMVSYCLRHSSAAFFIFP